MSNTWAIPTKVDHIFVPDEPPKSPGKGGSSQSWAVYNAMRDLPAGNRFPASKVKRDKARISRYVPRVVSAREILGGGKKSFAGTIKALGRIASVEPICMAIDASLRSTGVVVLFRVGDYIVAWSQRSGYGLSGSDLREAANRLLVVVKSVVGPIRTIRKLMGVESVPVLIEDYAFGIAKKGNTSSIVQLAELQGALKVQLLVLNGDPVQPVPISTARSKVLCKGSAKKDEILEAMVRGGFEFVRDEKWSDDEVDALVIALTHYTSTNEPDYAHLAWEELYPGQ
jgi:Holliday junction resolvasome RuvABC endonuclease subunit